MPDKKGTDLDLAFEWRARAKELEFIANKACIALALEQKSGRPVDEIKATADRWREHFARTFQALGG